jgi:hypothetical protein
MHTILQTGSVVSVRRSRPTGNSDLLSGITGITIAETGEAVPGAVFEISPPNGKFHLKSTE